MGSLIQSDLCSYYEGLLLLRRPFAFEHVLKFQDTLNVVDLVFNAGSFFDNTFATWQSFIGLGMRLCSIFSSKHGLDTTC